MCTTKSKFSKASKNPNQINGPTSGSRPVRRKADANSLRRHVEEAVPAVAGVGSLCDNGNPAVGKEGRVLMDPAQLQALDGRSRLHR